MQQRFFKKLWMWMLFVTISFASTIHAQTLFNQSQSSNAPSTIGLDPSTLLRPTQAFIPSIHVQDVEKGELVLMWDINPDYYLYKEKIFITLKNSNGELEEIILPKGKDYEDEFFGKQEIYDSSLIIPFQIQNAGNINTAYFEIEAQGCAKSGYCFAPQTYELQVAINPDIDPNNDALTENRAAINDDMPEIIAEHDRLSQYLEDNQYLAIPLFFVLGLLLTFTPCVLPMLPILSGILTRSGQISPKKGFSISLVYVLSMGFVYTIVGLLAAYFGKGLAGFLQNSYTLIGFGSLFILLSLSMFGLYQIQMPAFIQSRLSILSNKQSGKSNYLGTAIMGMLSALIVGPCVTAPLIGIITLVAQTQNYFLGGAALFSMSMGMGVPLLILGTSSGHLLPKVGPWMDKIKTLFGFMLLGLAAYFIGLTLPLYWEQMLYATIAFAAVIWLIVAIVESPGKIRLFFGALALGTMLFGAQSVNDSTRVIETATFMPIKGISGLNEGLAQNRGRVSMLEFNAEWCVACKEMEKYVFSDPEVKAKMAEMHLLVSDVTKNDAQDQRLQEHFNIFGPPAMLFFDQEGKEMPNFRVMGSVPKEDFLRHINYIIENYQN